MKIKRSMTDHIIYAASDAIGSYLRVAKREKIWLTSVGPAIKRGEGIDRG